jgi:hypothetical protein
MTAIIAMVVMVSGNSLPKIFRNGCGVCLQHLCTATCLLQIVKDLVIRYVACQTMIISASSAKRRRKIGGEGERGKARG